MDADIASKEIWRDVPGWAHLYAVSDKGRVRSKTRVQEALSRTGNTYSQTFAGRLLKATIGKNGYPMVTFIEKNGKRQYWCLHQLVLLAFRGAKPEGLEGCHKDGVKTHNWLGNLRYGTPKSNGEDRARHGHINPRKGQDSRNAKLTNENVREIRLLRDIYTQRELAVMYGVTHGVIGGVQLRKSWKRI